MKKIFEYDPMIYPRKIWVAVGASTEELSAEFVGIDDMGDADIAVTYYTVRKSDKKYGVLIRFRKRGDITPSVSSHEAVHAALEIFRCIGAEVDVENQEPLAYIVDWITDCIWKSKNYKEKNYGYGTE